MGVAAEHRIGEPGGIGGDQGDFAVDLVVDHVLAHVLDAQERAGDIGVDHPAEFRFREIVDVGVAPYGGAVDEDVHGAEGLVRGFHQVNHVFLLAHVGAAEYHPVSAESRLGQDGQGVVPLLLGTAGDHHIGAALEQPQGNVEAEAGGGAGDNGGLAPDGEHLLHGARRLDVAFEHGDIGGVGIIRHSVSSFLQADCIFGGFASF